MCTPIRKVEVSVSFIAVWDDDRSGENTGHFEYVVQAKALVKAAASGRWGIGAVAGTGRDPALAGTSTAVKTVYAYLPVTLSLAGDRLMLHQNIG